MNQLKRVAVLLAFVLAGFSSSASAVEFRNPLALAQEYLGLHQERDRSELRELLNVDPRRIPWCAAFVNRILEMAGYSGSDNLMARSFLSVGERVRKPVHGDIVVLTRGSDPASGHVGFYMGEEGGYVIVLGGNQQKAVRISHYPKSRVLGYRRLGGSNVNIVTAQPEARSDCNRSLLSPDFRWTQSRCPS
jgi:uncharacterized protein (TIGR02594 family)